MALAIIPPLETAFQDADKPDQRLDLFLVRDRLVRVLADIGKFTPEQIKGNFALVRAVDFQPRRMYGEPIWDMYWQPLGSAVDHAGKNHYLPDAADVDVEVIDSWKARAQSARHPLLRARYGDLAWEVAYFRRRELGLRRRDVTMARIAIESYLDAVERTLFIDDIYAWNDIERAIELALSINDASSVQRGKAVLFKFRAEAEARDDRYAFWRFHQIAWEHAAELDLTAAERAEIVRVLESQLALRSDISNPRTFDPHLATTAADALKLWRDDAGESAEANRAAHTAGQAFEAAAAKAGGLTSIMWLTDQLARYRQLGDQAGIGRVERAIREHADEAQGEMQRISVPLGITPAEVEAWADRVAGDNLDQALQGLAHVGVVDRASTERGILERAQGLSAHLAFIIIDRDGFPTAAIGSVRDDLDGQVVARGAQLVSQQGPWLNVAWRRIQGKHGADLEALLEWLSRSPCFPPERLPFIREGLAAWLAGDSVKAVHVLVPQIESALRDSLAALGGVVTKQGKHGGSQKISLGEVLAREQFAQVPEALRFHFQVVYADSRGLNIRNHLAHGILAFELLGLGLAHIVVHSIILIGTFRLTPAPVEGAPP